MTRMRAAELGLDVIHAAVTGKSTVIGAGGSLGDVSGLGTQQVVYGAVAGRTSTTLYATVGDALMIAAALIGVVTWWCARRPLVASAPETDEEE
jgi:apolipoprotein N-acyltransferase